MDDANTRVQNAINKLVNDVDKNVLRKMQVEMFKCSARCSENYDMSIQQVQECISRCNGPSERADAYLQSEMQGFQNRLQRCAMDCRDKANDKLGAAPTERDKQLASTSMEKCVVTCVDSHLALIPAMFDRIKRTISQQN